jgi:hypothetical protein
MQLCQPRLTFRLIFAFGLGLAVHICLSAEAWAAYQGLPPETANWVAIKWSLIAIVFGFGLYAARCWSPFYYGLVEVIAGLCTIYFNIAPEKQPGSTV